MRPHEPFPSTIGMKVVTTRLILRNANVVSVNQGFQTNDAQFRYFWSCLCFTRARVGNLFNACAVDCTAGRLKFLKRKVRSSSSTRYALLGTMQISRDARRTLVVNVCATYSRRALCCAMASSVVSNGCNEGIAAEAAFCSETVLRRLYPC